MRRLYAVLLMVIAILVLTPPPAASAHISTCSANAFPVYPLGGETRLVQAIATLECEPVTGHESVLRIYATIEYEVDQWGPNTWRGIPPAHRSWTGRDQLSARPTVECANGTKNYRLRGSFRIEGNHGSRETTKFSKVTRIRCTKTDASRA